MLAEFLKQIQNWISERKMICLTQVQEGKQPIIILGQILKTADESLFFYSLEHKTLMHINFNNIDELVEA